MRPPEPLFAAILRQACLACAAPMGLLFLDDGQQRRVLAQVGWPGAHEWVAGPAAELAAARPSSAGNGFFEVEDTRLDPRWVNLPGVASAPGLRALAGVALAQGAGWLCLSDLQPRRLGAAQIQALTGLAEIAGHALAWYPPDGQDPATAGGRELRVRAVGEAEFESGRAVRSPGAVQDVPKRHGPEADLTNSEGFLRQLADSVPLRIAYLDRERRYRFVNLAMSRVFGRTQAEIIGRSRDELRPDEDHSALAARAQAALGGQAQQFEFDDIVDGQLRRFENRLIPDRADSGEVRGFFVTGIDITERNAAERALRELTVIIDNTTDMVVQTDLRGRVLYMNPSARRAVALPADADLARYNFADFNTEATNELFAQTILPAVRRAGVWVGETTVNLAGRPAVPMSHMVIAHVGAQGRIERFSSVLRDISAEVLAKNRLLQQAEILRSVTEAIPATVVVVGTDGRYRFANSAFERLCGLPREQIIGRLAREVLGDAEIDRRRPWVLRALAGETVDFTLEYPSAQGSTHLALSCIPLRLASGAVDGFVGVSQDITQHKREEGRLTQLALRDPLTGLLNRAGFEQGLDLLQLRLGAGGLALLYIDLDDFKPVNDRHGHPAGDQVLALFAQRLQTLVRPTDLVARLGGDEFAVALAGMREASHAALVADKVLAAGRAPFEVGPLRLNVGATVGVAFSRDPRRPWRELLALADARLLHAKAAGKGRQAAAEA